MSYRDPQNPGISTTNELTLAELELVQSIAALGDPGADRILFWDETANAFAYLTVGSGLTITDTTITSSSSVPTQITIANEATDTTCFPVFVTAATGDLAPKSNAGLTFNSATGNLGATILSSTSLTASELLATDANKNLVSLAVATYPSLTELSYVKGVTSAIQTQIDALSNAVVLKGTWDASAGTFPGAGAAQAGWSYIVSVGGTVDGVVFTANDRIVAITDNASTTTYATNWFKLDYTDQVLSVFSRTGAITAADGDYSQSLITGLKTTDSPQFAGVNIGDASDTTITRVSAGVIAVEGVTVPTISSTNDISNKNLTSGNSISGEISLDGTPNTDATAVGNVTSTFASGYSSAVGDLVFFGSGGKWLEVDSDAVATCQGLIGIALEAKTDTQAMKVALPGSFVRLDSWNWTVGATLYAGETLGAMQETIPTGADAIIKVVGFAVSADVVFFMPSSDQQSTIA